MATDTMIVEMSIPAALLFRLLEKGKQSEDDERVLHLLKQAANEPLRNLPEKKQKNLIRRCQRAEQATLTLFKDQAGQYINGAVMGHALLLWVESLLEHDILVVEQGSWMEVAIDYLADELKPYWPLAERFAPDFVPLIYDVLREQGLYLR